MSRPTHLGLARLASAGMLGFYPANAPFTSILATPSVRAAAHRLCGQLRGRVPRLWKLSQDTYESAMNYFTSILARMQSQFVAPCGSPGQGTLRLGATRPVLGDHKVLVGLQSQGLVSNLARDVGLVGTSGIPHEYLTIGAAPG
jgi:hypothetical protein